MTTTLESARPADALRTRPINHRQWWLHPVVAATIVAGILHVLWAVFLAGGGGDLAAQSAWADFALRHPTSAYDLAWYGGMHPASYSVISPYLMAILGVRTTGVIAGTLSASLLAVLLMRSGIARPLAPALWGAFSLSCNAVSGRVTFSLGVLFGLAAVTMVFVRRGRPAPRAAAILAFGVLSTLASPVAGLFLEVAAAALFLTRRRKSAYVLAAGPPFVVAGSAILFPFSGVQPFPWFLVAAPVASAVALAIYAPASWRSVRAGAVVYAFGTVLTWIIPSQVGSNVDRLALLFGGAVILAAAMERKLTILYVAFAATVISQVVRPVFDVVNTSGDEHASSVVDELRRLGADRARVEVVPERTHLEASELATQVNLARGWNRQADVDRNPLFYDGSLNTQRYHDWLRRWAVQYVVLSDSSPDWPGIHEARIVRDGQSWLPLVWHDRHWRLYRLTDPSPLADPPATVVRAGDGEIDLDVPSAGWVLVRVPWSPWLGVLDGTSRGCVVQAGDWTKLYAPAPGRYRLGGSYQLPRGAPC